MLDLEVAEALCKRFEGFRAKPYLCPAGVPTVGYGTTHYPDGTKVKLTDDPVSQEKAVELLYIELNRCARSLVRLSPELLAYSFLEDNFDRFGALVDFIYNLGPGNYQISTLRKCVNNRERWSEVPYQLSRWNKGGGRVLPGLVARRLAESSYWNKEVTHG